MEAREESAGGFKKETVNKLLQLHFKDDKTRASGDAVLLVAEMLNVFVREAAARGARQAMTESITTVEVEHVEKILPQLRILLARTCLLAANLHNGTVPAHRAPTGASNPPLVLTWKPIILNGNDYAEWDVIN